MRPSIAPKAALQAFEDWSRSKLSFEALLHATDPLLLGRLSLPSIDLAGVTTEVLRGVAASAGVATGVACTSASEAKTLSQAGHDVVLVCSDLVREDAPALSYVRGVVLTHAGLTSHGAILCRGAGVPCVLGGKGLVDAARAVGGIVTLDGASGAIVLGDAPRVTAAAPAVSDALEQAKRVGAFRVDCFAATRDEVRRAKLGGASRIGLVRLEHVLARHGHASLVASLTSSEGPARWDGPALEVAIARSLSALGLAGDHDAVALRLLDVEDGPRGPALEEAFPGITARQIAGAEASRIPVRHWIAPFVSHWEDLATLRTALGAARAPAAAMIETPGAAQDIEAIAAVCSSLLVGLGDLLVLRKGKSRRELTPNDFDAVEAAFVADALVRARAAAPGVELAIAGLDALSVALVEDTASLRADACVVAPHLTESAHWASARARLRPASLIA